MFSKLLQISPETCTLASNKNLRSLDKNQMNKKLPIENLSMNKLKNKKRINQNRTNMKKSRSTTNPDRKIYKGDKKKKG